MTTIEVCIDVPDLEEGKRFYRAALGLKEEPSPVPNVVVLSAENVRICLLKKDEGSQPSPTTTDRRTYRRHWTPVHLDFRVAEISTALQRAIKAGAVVESDVQSDEYGSWVPCADPFGNGFCFIRPKW